MRMFLFAAALGCLAGAARADDTKPLQRPAPSDLTQPPKDAQVSKSGLVSRVLKKGNGKNRPSYVDTVTVVAVGWNKAGKVVDGSPGGKPEELKMISILTGLREGIELMVPGEHRRLWLPDRLAYKGQNTSPANNGDLVYDIELISIKPGPKPLPPPPDLAQPPKDAKTTKLGVIYKVLQAGTGKKHPIPTDQVWVEYTIWDATNGRMQWTTPPGKSELVQLDQMPKGFGDGLLQLVVGDRARLWIPPELAFAGRAGAPEDTIVVDVAVNHIAEPPPPPPPPPDVAKAPADAQKTASGLFYKILKRGQGTTHPTADGKVDVRYTGWTTDGKSFDDSLGSAVRFKLAEVIPGWTEGLQLLSEGDQARFWIPVQLAYKGKKGQPAGTLVFDIELVKIR